MKMFVLQRNVSKMQKVKLRRRLRAVQSANFLAIESWKAFYMYVYIFCLFVCLRCILGISGRITQVCIVITNEQR